MKKVIRALVVVVICLLVGAIVYLESSSFRHIVSNIPLISSTLDSAYKKLEIHTLATHEMVTDAAGNSVYKEYYYGTLNEKQQKFYDEIKDDVQSLNLSSFHYVSGFDTDVEDVQLAIEALSKDYPEYFFIDNNGSQLKYGGFKEHIKYYTIEYKDDKEEALKQYHEIDSMAKQITSEVEGMPDLDKVKYFNKYIMDNVEYAVKSEYNQDVRSAFINKETVCAGYTKMFKVLCNYSGINCIFIGGEVKDYEDDKRLLVWGESEGHAWNVVQIDGKYYWADITANDCISSNEFLMCPNDFFLKTHIISDDYLLEQVTISEESK